MGKRERHKNHNSGTAAVDGEGAGIRTLRLQELIKNEANILLRNEMRDPRLQNVDVTMVDLSRDGSCARLWISTETFEAVESALNRAAGFMRSQMAESLGIKRMPELRFRRDNATRTLGLQHV